MTAVIPRLTAPVDLGETQLVPRVNEFSRAREMRGTAALAQLAWLVPAVVMAVLGLIRLSWPSLWGDELATWGMATTSWPQMFSVLRSFDVVMLPYYVLVHAWTTVFGTSDFALRLPSVMAMTAAVAITARIGVRLANPRIGLIAGLFLAFIPTTTRYAQEARPYAFVVLAAAVATLTFLRAMERPQLGRMVAYVGSIALVGLFNIVALLIVLAHGAVVLLHHRRAFPQWASCVVLGSLPVVPLVLLGDQQKGQVSWIPAATFSRLVSLPTGLFGVGVLGGAVVALALLSVSLRPPAVYYALGAIVPLAALYLAAQATPLWLPRYLLFTLPAWALLAATPFTGAPVVRGIVAVAVIGAVGFPFQVDVRQEDGHTQDSRAAAIVIEQNMLPGDVIVYGPNALGEGRVGRDIVSRYVPAERRPADPLVVLPPRTAGNFMPTECQTLATCFKQPARVWVLRVGTFNNPTYLIGDDKARLLTGYKVQSEWYPTGLTVALLVKKPA